MDRKTVKLVEKMFIETQMGINMRDLLPPVAEIIEIIATAVVQTGLNLKRRNVHSMEKISDTMTWSREDADMIRGAIMAVTPAIRLKTYAVLAQIKTQEVTSATMFLHVTMSAFSKKGLALTEEELREVLILKLMDKDRVITEVLHPLLACCTLSIDESFCIIEPPVGYPFATIKAFREAAHKKGDSAARLATLTSENEEKLKFQGLDQVLVQAAALLDEHHTELIRERQVCFDGHEGENLNELEPEQRDQLTEFLLLLADIAADEKPMKRLRDRECSKIILGSLCGLSPTERITLLSLIQNKPELSGICGILEEFLKRPNEDTTVNRLQLLMQWNKIEMPSMMLHTLWLLTEEWNWKEGYSNDRDIGTYLPPRYTEAVHQRAVHHLQKVPEKELRTFRHPLVQPKLVEHLLDILQHPDGFPEPQLIVLHAESAPSNDRTQTIVSTENPQTQDEIRLAEEQEKLTQQYMQAEQQPLMQSIALFGLSENMLPDLLEAVHFTRSQRMSTRLRVLEEKASKFEDAFESVGYSDFYSIVESAAVALGMRYQELVAAIAKACGTFELMPSKRGTDSLTQEEILNLRHLLLRTCLQLEQYLQQLPREGEPAQSKFDTGFSRLLADCSVASAAQYLLTVHLQERYGARIRRYPVFAACIEAAMHELQDILELESTMPTDLKRILNSVLPWINEALEICQKQHTTPVPLSILIEELSQYDIDARTFFPEDTTAMNGVRSGEVVSTKNPKRRAVEKYLRHRFPSTSRHISFDDAKEVLASAGIIAEKWSTEHPWYWTCSLPGHSGRHAITWSRSEQGFFISDLLHVLFGRGPHHGIGDIDALFESLPDRWKTL